MSTWKEIQDYLNDLTPEELQIARNHFSSMEGTQDLKKEEIKTNLYLKSKEWVKKQWNKKARSEAKQATKKQADNFCGISIDQLTKTQQKLFDKLSPEQRQELSQKVSINKTEEQIEFLQIKKAIKDKDIAVNITKSLADHAVEKLWNKWELPRDVDYTDANRRRLDPVQSDYDAMILQMPGVNDEEKAENFILLTGMIGRHWTSQRYNKSKSEFVIRIFNIHDRVRNRNDVNNNSNVRPVRSL
jgi:hypothetical protein